MRSLEAADELQSWATAVYYAGIDSDFDSGRSASGPLVIHCCEPAAAVLSKS